MLQVWSLVADPKTNHISCPCRLSNGWTSLKVGCVLSFPKSHCSISFLGFAGFSLVLVAMLRKHLEHFYENYII